MTQNQKDTPQIICDMCSQTIESAELALNAATHFLSKKHKKSMFNSNYNKPAIFLPGKIKLKTSLNER